MYISRACWKNCAEGFLGYSTVVQVPLILKHNKISNLKCVGWCIKLHTDAPWLQDCVDWTSKRHLLYGKYSWNEVFWQPKPPFHGSSRRPSDFTSVFNTGLQHKNKQFFCSAQFFQNARNRRCICIFILHITVLQYWYGYRIGINIQYGNII